MARKEAKASSSDYIGMPFWNAKGNLNEGDQLEGYLIDKEEYTTKFGETTSYIVEKLDGEKVKVAGQADIKAKLANVPMGSHIWVEYMGLTETVRGAKKTYTIDFDDEDVKM